MIEYQETDKEELKMLSDKWNGAYDINGEPRVVTVRKAVNQIKFTFWRNNRYLCFREIDFFVVD